MRVETWDNIRETVREHFSLKVTQAPKSGMHSKVRSVAQYLVLPDDKDVVTDSVIGRIKPSDNAVGYLRPEQPVPNLPAWIWSL